MRKVIVTTTINPVTTAVERFQALEDWELIVVGDLKTPDDYHLENGTYYGPEEQEKFDKALSDAIGWNRIQRRNFGLLFAHERQPDIIAVVDDDNIPEPGWGEELFIGREIDVNYYETDLPAFDPVGATNYVHLWHRGYPLQLLSKRDYSRKTQRRVTPNVQADFWNGDPDIDAICRMEHAPECSFDPAYFPIAANRMAPFNSQNTFLAGSILGDYFLFPHIGRMDDIWAAYYLQAKGNTVVFGQASVYQERNEHDLTIDMLQELIGYENNLRIVEDLATDPEAIVKYIPTSSFDAFQLYQRHFDRA